MFYLNNHKTAYTIYLAVLIRNATSKIKKHLLNKKMIMLHLINKRIPKSNWNLYREYGHRSVNTVREQEADLYSLQVFKSVCVCVLLSP